MPLFVDKRSCWICWGWMADPLTGMTVGAAHASPLQPWKNNESKPAILIVKLGPGSDTLPAQPINERTRYVHRVTIGTKTPN